MELQFEQILPAPKPPLRKALKRRIKETYRYDTLFWLVSLSGLWAADIAALTLTALGLPTGYGLFVDLSLFVGGGSVLLAIAANLAALLLALTGLPVPRLYLSAFLATAAAVLIIFHTANVRWDVSIAVALFFALVGALAGFVLGVFTRPRTPLWRKGCLAVLPAVLCLALVYALLQPQLTSYALQAAGSLADAEGVADTVSISDEADATDAGGITPSAAEDPAQPGAYRYREFTYGSGEDKRRTEFGNQVLLKSGSVDASSMITNWSGAKSRFWGFDEQALPLNGRVWMPEGAGPFPLVLLVHGNHLMEDYSDDGYAYLGELLASRGFIAVSVDENFLNYSAWSGIPNNDYKVRAWLLLKHLQQIDVFASDSSSPFYNQVDFDRIGLIGHSRGGQAVAMAADPSRWFADDAGLGNLDQFHIRSVAAIAPTDKLVSNTSARLSNVNYLSLQGSQDGDVNDFYGDRQYDRTSFDPGSSAFKSTLYIQGANHSQFNTSWGHYDVSFPAGVLLSRGQMLSGDEQRQIAKVYISAFMEDTLHGQTAYNALFRDYRFGADWLPQTAYFNQYEDGQMTLLADYNEDRSKTTIRSGGTAQASNATWSEEEAKDRDNNNKGKRGVVLEWTPEEGGANDASYSLDLSAAGSGLTAAFAEAEGLSFAMTNRNDELAEKYPNAPDTPTISIELQSSDGNSAVLPLTQFMKVLPLPESKFTLNSWLEDKLEGSKYKNPTEAVFQTYRLDFAAFVHENANFDPRRLTKIIFHLGQGPGKIMLTDIGLYS